VEKAVGTTHFLQVVRAAHFLQVVRAAHCHQTVRAVRTAHCHQTAVVAVVKSVTRPVQAAEQTMEGVVMFGML